MGYATTPRCGALPSSPSHRLPSETLPASGGRPVIAPPWSVERDFKDKPPWDQVCENQRHYREILDAQAAHKASQRRQCEEESAMLDRTTIMTLATSTHTWETETRNPVQERANFEELVATAASRRSKHKKLRESECEEQRRHAAQAQHRLEELVGQRKQQTLKERANLTAAWGSAVEEKRRQKEQERASELLVEREHLAWLATGMRKPRRLRKPQEALLATL